MHSTAGHPGCYCTNEELATVLEGILASARVRRSMHIEYVPIFKPPAMERGSSTSFAWREIVMIYNGNMNRR